MRAHPGAEGAGPQAQVTGHLGHRQPASTQEVDLAAASLVGDPDALAGPAPVTQTAPREPALHSARGDLVDATDLARGGAGLEDADEVVQVRGAESPTLLHERSPLRPPRDRASRCKVTSTSP